MTIVKLSYRFASARTPPISMILRGEVLSILGAKHPAGQQRASLGGPHARHPIRKNELFTISGAPATLEGRVNQGLFGLKAQGNRIET